jgi:ADP-ribosyl-[dinitrogen reductase] hydrolase
MIAHGQYRNKSAGEIRGTGYVVESLEAALWCFHQTESFEAAILKAANLGDDADTTAAICGQVAGAYYGESGIPKKWLDKLAMGQEIATLAESLLAANQRG